jgi:hypothetical protein
MAKKNQRLYGMKKLRKRDVAATAMYYGMLMPLPITFKPNVMGKDKIIPA